MEFLTPYESGILALGLLGLLHLVQLVVADVVAIAQKHTPGTPVEQRHEVFLFRAVRAHANTMESLGAATIGAVFAIARQAPPETVNALLWGFLALRVGHMVAYYADWRIPRSVFFGLGLVALFVLFGTGLRA